MDAEKYLQSRVNEQISWMESKSKQNQESYKRLKVMEIVAAAAIPFLAGFHQVHRSFPIITGLLGFFIVVIGGIQQLQRYHENWIAYRATSESLKRERILFETSTDPYQGDQRYERFIQNFEALLADENKIWKTNVGKKSETNA